MEQWRRVIRLLRPLLRQQLCWDVGGKANGGSVKDGLSLAQAAPFNSLLAISEYLAPQGLKGDCLKGNCQKKFDIFFYKKRTLRPCKGRKDENFPRERFQFGSGPEENLKPGFYQPCKGWWETG